MVYPSSHRVFQSRFVRSFVSHMTSTAAYSVPSSAVLVTSSFVVLRGSPSSVRDSSLSSHSSVRRSSIHSSGSGVTSVMTPSMPWMTPLDASMSGATTLLPAMRTSPSVVLSILMAWSLRVGTSTGSSMARTSAAVYLLRKGTGRFWKRRENQILEEIKSRRFRHEGCRGAYRAHPSTTWCERISLRSGLARTSSTLSPDVSRNLVNASFTGANKVKGPSAARSSAAGATLVSGSGHQRHERGELWVSLQRLADGLELGIFLGRGLHIHIAPCHVHIFRRRASVAAGSASASVGISSASSLGGSIVPTAAVSPAAAGLNSAANATSARAARRRGALRVRHGVQEGFVREGRSGVGVAVRRVSDGAGVTDDVSRGGARLFLDTFRAFRGKTNGQDPTRTPARSRRHN